MPSVTISSAGTSTPIVTEYLGGRKQGRRTSAQVNFSSSTSSAACQMQGTLNDPRSSAARWFALSTNTFTSSDEFDSGVFLSLKSPVTGIRLNSTGLSSGSITLRVLIGA